jgi:hypothetical protein
METSKKEERKIKGERKKGKEERMILHILVSHLRHLTTILQMLIALIMDFMSLIFNEVGIMIKGV